MKNRLNEKLHRGNKLAVDKNYKEDNQIQTLNRQPILDKDNLV
jgi:hypothetical protein